MRRVTTPVEETLVKTMLDRPNKHLTSGRLQSNLRIPSLVTLVIVVLVLAVLQYRWIEDLSEGHETRNQSRVRDTVRALTNAIDTEVTRAALVFKSPLAAMPSRFDELERRWTKWNDAARWPRIISGVALLEWSDGSHRARWLGSPATSDVASILRALEPQVLTTQGPPRRKVFHDRGTRELIIDAQPAFVLPLSASSMRPGITRLSSVLIRYDGDYLAGTVFRQLLEAHSTIEDRRDFQFEVKQGTGRGTPNEIVADVFHFRPDCLRAPAEPGVAAFLGAIVHCEISADTDGKGLMQLVARPQQPAINAALTRFRWRNQIVSSLVLATLLMTMAVLVISAERARKLARVQTIVAAGISHELRTPLASLRIAADDLKSGQVHSLAQARHYGEIVDAQSRRLGHVVDQALALAGATDAHDSPRFRAVSVIEIIDSAIDGLSPTLAQAKITIERRAAADLPRILADPDMLLRCLTNLIENSIKYASTGGCVFLSAQAVRRSGKSVVEITVEDRGPGIGDDEAAAVFEPFYRGTTARQSKQPGSGLGLAVVKSAVEAHGGWIDLERANPHGCRFMLFFPAADHAESERL